MAVCDSVHGFRFFPSMSADHRAAVAQRYVALLKRTSTLTEALGDIPAAMAGGRSVICAIWHEEAIVSFLLASRGPTWVFIDQGDAIPFFTCLGRRIGFDVVRPICRNGSRQHLQAAIHVLDRP